MTIIRRRQEKKSCFLTPHHMTTMTKICPYLMALFLACFHQALAFVPMTGLGHGQSRHHYLQQQQQQQPMHTTKYAAVSKKDSYEITLLTGDGIGPEISTATQQVLTALCKRFGFTMNLNPALIGGAAIDAVNDPFPDATLQQCRASDSILLACIGGYKWDANPRELRPETGLLKMRKELGLFANLRPAKVLPQLIDASTLKREVVEGVDVMVVRELTGDVYFGSPKGIETINGAYTRVVFYPVILI
jgi:isocitrate dehydrogenase